VLHRRQAGGAGLVDLNDTYLDVHGKKPVLLQMLDGRHKPCLFLRVAPPIAMDYDGSRWRVELDKIPTQVLT
jgi:hypothetical protein